jgi:putative hemolysin
MAGTTFASGATLKDPEAIFVGLASGAKGYCVAQGGEYFAIQALCSPEEGYV